MRVFMLYFPKEILEKMPMQLGLRKRIKEERHTLVRTTSENIFFLLTNNEIPLLYLLGWKVLFDFVGQTDKKTKIQDLVNLATKSNLKLRSFIT